MPLRPSVCFFLILENRRLIVPLTLEMTIVGESLRTREVYRIFWTHFWELIDRTWNQSGHEAEHWLLYMVWERSFVGMEVGC
ncbi:hypothetical protein B0F90DRAFT_1779214 [Multifurca ochricompacta]|uniref:Uncharacterized protein n=1 Tax=Multifurca ochricompacta TaxID=376703 RepID=A0AAD4LUX2_9AGAM|nr:hypothetical protein B0F90DRAFT_1779214 [Multifurca ochricompacta]